MNARHRAMRAYHGLYRLIDNGRICVYCGVPASTIDHVVPLSAISALANMILINGPPIEGLFLVPSCGECNSIAGSQMFRTIGAKRRYIHWRLSRKYRRFIELPDWSDEELDEMGYSLRKSIENGLRVKEWLLKRVSWRNVQNPKSVGTVAMSLRRVDSGRNSATKNASVRTTTS